jgi:uncharacterized protein (DUF697 family)
MKSIIELVFELAGGVILLFAVGYTFARISGYDKYYDKMLYDDDNIDLTIKKNNKDNDDDIIHHVSI